MALKQMGRSLFYPDAILSTVGFESLHIADPNSKCDNRAMIFALKPVNLLKISVY